MAGSWTNVDDHIDDALGLPNVSRLAELKNRYTRREACYAMCAGRPPSFSGEVFVKSLIDEVWKALPAPDMKRVLDSSWRWRLKPDHREKTRSPEVTLERCLVRLLGENELTYQMAVVAGVSKGSIHNRRAIDLVAHKGRGIYEFIELKMPKIGTRKENPLAAAMELVIYAAFYLCHRKALGPKLTQLGRDHRVFGASQVNLTVLGPDWFYNDTATKEGKRLTLRWLERELARGVAAVGNKIGCKMSFRFEQFLPSFEWPIPPHHPDMERTLHEAWKNRRRVSWQANSG